MLHKPQRCINNMAMGRGSDLPALLDIKIFDLLWRELMNWVKGRYTAPGHEVTYV